MMKASFRSGDGQIVSVGWSVICFLSKVGVTEPESVTCFAQKRGQDPLMLLSVEEPYARRRVLTPFLGKASVTCRRGDRSNQACYYIRC
jgi:hypothetical protein